LGGYGIAKIVTAARLNGPNRQSFIAFDEESLFHPAAYLQTSMATSGQASAQSAQPVHSASKLSSAG